MAVARQARGLSPHGVRMDARKRPAKPWGRCVPPHRKGARRMRRERRQRREKRRKQGERPSRRRRRQNWGQNWRQKPGYRRETWPERRPERRPETWHERGQSKARRRQRFRHSPHMRSLPGKLPGNFPENLPERPSGTPSDFPGNQARDPEGYWAGTLSGSRGNRPPQRVRQGRGRRIPSRPGVAAWPRFLASAREKGRVRHRPGPAARQEARFRRTHFRQTCFRQTCFRQARSGRRRLWGRGFRQVCSDRHQQSLTVRCCLPVRLPRGHAGAACSCSA